MIRPTDAVRRAVAAVRTIASAAARPSPSSRALPPDPFGLPPDGPSPEAQSTQRTIDNTIPRNFPLV